MNYTDHIRTDEFREYQLMLWSDTYAEYAIKRALNGLRGDRPVYSRKYFNTVHKYMAKDAR